MSITTQHEQYLAQLPEDWPRTTIAALGEIVGGGTPARGVKAYWGGDVPWITPGEISDHGTKSVGGTREMITKAGLSGSGATLLPLGSLMVTTRATLGARALNSVPMATNQGFRSIVFKRREAPDFYYYLFEKLQSELRRRASGTTFLEISGTEFGRIEVPSPCNGEKATIAQVLETLDAAIRQTAAIIDKLKHVKQGLMHDLLTRGLDENGKLRPPQSEAPQLYKQSPLGWIPRSWRLATVSELLAEGILRDVQDGNHGELHPKRDDFVREGIPFLMARDLADGRIDFSGCYRISRDQYRRLRIGFATAGDVLVSHKGTIGETAIVPEDQSEVMLTPQVTYYRPDPQRLMPKFLLAWMRSCYFQRSMKTLAAQSTRDYVGITAQKTVLATLVPASIEQATTAAIVGAMDERIAAEVSLASTLRPLRLGVIDDLLTGRVRVTSLLKE